MKKRIRLTVKDKEKMQISNDKRELIVHQELKLDIPEKLHKEEISKWKLILSTILGIGKEKLKRN
jgi:hypothetical protein